MSRKNGGIIGPANTPVGGIVTGVAGGVWRMNDVLNFVSNSQWPKAPENIENSCRFDDGSTDNLSRTLSSTGNQKKFTISLWTKPSTFQQQMFLSTASNKQYGFESDHRVFFYENLGGGTERPYIRWAPLCRDVSAWYHIVLGVDTTQSTDTDRMKLYINGTLITEYASTPTHPSLNQDLNYNNNSLHVIGKYSGTTGGDYDGYMAEYVFVDGQQLDATSFGETDSTTGIWKPKKIGGFSSAGDNSFYLDFKDSSNLGNDASGLNNDFTVNNLTSIDQSTDTCVENFAILNPLHRGNELGNATFSNGNLKHEGTSSGSNYPYTFSTLGVSQGKWYAEFKAVVADTTMIGIASGIADSFLGATGSAKGYGRYGNSGQVFESGSGSSYGSALSNNDIVGVAMDLDNNKLYFSVNGTFQNSGVPTSGSTGTGAVSITAPASNGTGVYHFACGKAGSTTTSIEANFGNPPFSISSGNSDANGHGNFEYSVPSGYYALNTSNLNTYG